MKFKNHIKASLLAGLIIYPLYNNLYFLISFFIAAVFIDLDHCFDYVRETGDYKVTLKKMEKYFYKYDYEKAVIFLHSYEILVFIFLLNYLLLNTTILYGIVSGLLFHIIMDIIFNPVYIKAYSFFYRFQHSFVKQKILKM